MGFMHVKLTLLSSLKRKLYLDNFRVVSLMTVLSQLLTLAFELKMAVQES
jgi:hypothetical protein